VGHGSLRSRDIRFEERTAPTIMKPTDAIIRITATCVCGSHLWPYRGINRVAEPTFFMPYGWRSAT
jgi:threonine dehydrogenase-like Zn-dependent dehydrogenase